MHFYVKRDDQTANVYGGAKVRKLEHLLAEAKRQERKWVVAWGGVGSHQAVSTAIFGTQLGLHVALLLVPQTPTVEVAQNVLIDLTCGILPPFLFFRVSTSFAGVCPRMDSDPVCLHAPPKVIIHARERTHVCSGSHVSHSVL